MFAGAWIDKMTYFYELWLSQKDSDHVFTDEEILGFEEPADFAVMASSFTKKAQKTRLNEFRGLAPRLL